MKVLNGKAIIFGDNIDTDLIIPGQYLNITQADELAKVCMAGIEENFSLRVNEGDIIVAGRNFGCGSSREHAPVSIKAAGISCIIAKSFARIFYRNSINIGLPVIECAHAVDCISENDEVKLNLEKGIINNISKEETYSAIPFPPFMLELLQNEGMVNYITRKYRQKTR